MRGAVRHRTARLCRGNGRFPYTRSLVRPKDHRGHPGTGTLSHALHAFVHRYNGTARPFNWKFTADDLTALLRRISQREQAATSQQATMPQAA